MTIWLAMSTLVMIVVVGLAVDLTGQVHAQQRTRDLAAQAARSGAQQINDAQAMRGDGIQLNPSRAVQAAQTYLQAAGVEGTATVKDGQTLTVTSSDTYHPKFLSIIGLSKMPVSGQATVRAARVVNGVEQ